MVTDSHEKQTLKFDDLWLEFILNQGFCLIFYNNFPFSVIVLLLFRIYYIMSVSSRTYAVTVDWKEELLDLTVQLELKSIEVKIILWSYYKANFFYN